MGREAQCQCTLNQRSHSVHAQLESSTLILRGATLKRNFQIPALTDLRSEDGMLRFMAGGENIALALGRTEAPKWLKKMTTPPPSLATKLQIHPGAPAFVYGHADDPALVAALSGATTNHPAEANVLVAVVLQDDDLSAAIALHATMPCPAVWVVYRKGPTAVPGEKAIRQRLRAVGYMDNKVSAVSNQLTATRYARQ